MFSMLNLILSFLATCKGTYFSVYAFIVMVTLRNRADHYIFALWFVVSSFFYLSFFSFLAYSHRRLDVCHTSTHGVALVRI